MITKHVRFVLVLAGLLVAAAPALAQRGHYDRDGAFRLKVGLFTPEGDSQYWNDKAEDFTGGAEDLENISFGLEYLLSVGPRTSVLFSGNFFEGDTTQAYEDFEDNFGDRILHDTTLDILSLTAGFVFHLTEPDAPIRPYLGVGGGVYSWRLEEAGDFIDLDTLEIFNATLESDGVVLGYYGVVGVEVPIGRTVSFFGEGRFHRAEDELSGDFEGLGFGDIDLSGREISAGLSWSM
jgi:hypothetical protein